MVLVLQHLEILVRVVEDRFRPALDVQQRVGVRRARELQLDLFDEALSELADAPDLVNQVLEISIDTEDQIIVLRYELPAES